MSVYLVGAGPGDVDLLTLRAAQLLASADVVVHDRLIGEEILDLISPHTVRIDVGKVPGAADSQDAINELLGELSLHYETVVRLKGGDPFVFGRARHLLGLRGTAARRYRGDPPGTLPRRERRDGDG
jgi:siroheme synthase